jgi:hypothetical protein
MPDLRSLPRTQYGGIQTSSRPRITYGVNSSREPPQRLAPGFHRESWIPAGVYPDKNRGRNDTSLLNLSLWTDTKFLSIYVSWVDKREGVLDSAVHLVGGGEKASERKIKINKKKKKLKRGRRSK